MAKITILLVDYEPRSIERFRQPLESAGYVVEIATDGLAGIEAFHRLNPDMVLVEAMIPKKHGFEVCQELKRTPHGRRTPILITTGVYKGRKYRTQALHIYGCDEYIEKPIAAEQLLVVVGKFFSGGGSGPGPSAGSSANDDARPGGTSSAQDASSPAAPTAPSTAKPVAAAPTPAQMRVTSHPIAVGRDFTEEEIMARLDAILPSQESASTAQVDPTPIALAVVEADPLYAPDAVEERNPFLQMQAELTAELGSLSAALALEPAPILEPEPEAPPIPSDQASAPSLLEALPLPSEVPPILEPIPEAAPAAAVPQGQVVHFDAKRSKKHKKSGRRGHEAQQAARSEPAAERPQASPVTEATGGTVTPEVEPQEFSIPPGSVLAGELGAAPQKRALPTWIWAIALVGVGVGIYFGFFRNGENGSASVPSATVGPQTPAAPAKDADSAPAPTPPVRSEVAAPPVSTPTIHPSSHPPSAPVTAGSSSKTLSPPAVPSAKAIAPSPAVAAEPKAVSPQRSVPVPVPPVTAQQGAATTKPEAADPALLGDAGSGVDSIAAAPELPAKPSVQVGALVPIGEVDSAPVTLSRRVPIYSMQARQMRVQGTVVLNVLINEHGTVDDVVIVTGVPGADLNESAVKAAKQWTYQPATKGGAAVKVWKQESVSFKL